MKIIKLLGIFILIATGVITAFNLDSILGFSHEDEEFPDKDTLDTSEEKDTVKDNPEDMSPTLIQPTLTTKTREQLREEVIQLACQRNLQACEQHEGWMKALTMKEKIIISSVINPDQFYKDLNLMGKRLLEDTKKRPLTNENDIFSLYHVILYITCDDRYKKKI